MSQDPTRATSARVAAKVKRDDMMDISEEDEAPSAPVSRKKSKGSFCLGVNKPTCDQGKVNDKLIPSRTDRLRSLYYDARFNVLCAQRVFEGHDERAIEKAIERGNMVWAPFVSILQKYNMLIKTKSVKSAATKEVSEALTSGTVPLPCIIETTEILDNEAITVEAELLFAGAPHAEVTKKESGVNYEFYEAYGDLKDTAYYEYRCPFVYVIRRVSKPTALLQSVVGTHFSSFHAFFRLVTNNMSVDGFDKWKLHGTQISMRDVLKKYSFQNCMNKEDTLTFPVLRNVYKVKTATAIEELVPNMPCTIAPDIGREANAAVASASATSAQGTESALNAKFEQSLRANTYAETVNELATVSVVDVLLAQCLYECNGITCDPINCHEHDLMNTKGTWKCRHGVVHWDRINLDPKNNAGNDLIMDNSVLIRMHKDKENKNFKLEGYSPKWHTRLRHDEYGRSVWDNRVFFGGNDKVKAISAPRDLDECRLYGYSFLCTFLQPYKERHYGFYETELLARDVVSKTAQFDALINCYHPTVLSTFKQNAAFLQGGVYRQTYALRLPQHLVLVRMSITSVLPKLSHTARESVFYVPVETLLIRSPIYSTLATMFEPFPGALHNDLNIKDAKE